MSDALRIIRGKIAEYGVGDRPMSPPAWMLELERKLRREYAPDIERDEAPVAPDTEAARWEAAYCIERNKCIEINSILARAMSSLSVAARALSRYAAQPNGGEQAMAALEHVQQAIRKPDSSAMDHESRECVLVAVAAGELSEGQACRLLGVDRICVRGLLLDALQGADRLWREFRAQNPVAVEFRDQDVHDRHL